MARVRLFVKDTETTFLKSTVTKQGDRAIDQAKIYLPTCNNVEPNNDIKYVQDIASLTDLKLMLTTDCSTGDDSGYDHHANGFINIPTYLTRFEFENNVNDTGCLCSTATINCGCATFTCGKVGNGVTTRAFCFDGTRYITLNNECKYDFRQDQNWSISTWVYPTVACMEQALITKRDALTCDGGYSLSINACNNIQFDIATNVTENNITSMCTVPLCMWTHVVATYAAVSNRSGIKLYINGELDTTGTCMAIGTPVVNCCNVALGATSVGGSLFTGRLDDSYIFRKELTADQSTNLYQRGALSYQCGKWGKSVGFDGESGHFVIPDDVCDFDLSGKFEMIWWMKADNVNCCDRYIFSKATTACNGIKVWIECATAVGGPGFTASGYTASGFTNAAMCSTTQGALNVKLGTTTISGNIDVTTCAFQQIRIKRDACDLVTITICDVVDETCTLAGDFTVATPIDFARNFDNACHFDGELDSFRWYKGNLSCTDNKILFNNINPINILKFGGQVTKIEKEIVRKEILAHSHGKQLGDIEVRTKLYENKSPEFIVHDLILNNTDFISIPFQGVSGITLLQYFADGKLFDIIDQLMSLFGATFYTDALRLFHCVLRETVFKPNVFKHGNNTSIFETKFDDTELVNELTILGKNVRYDKVCTFCGTGSQVAFTLLEPPTSVRVNVCTSCMCVEQCPENDFIFSTPTRVVTFDACSIPACGAGITVSYEFERPISAQGRCQASIDANGIHSKRLITPYIETRSDGVRFIGGYLNRFGSLRTNLQIEHPFLLGSLRENDVVQAINSIKDIDSTFVIKSIKWEYPAFKTTLEVGQYLFSDYEYDKQIIGKIHDLEEAILTVKTLRDFENPQEVLALCDVVQVAENDIILTECLGMTDCVCVTENFNAIYDRCDCACGADDGQTVYDGNDSYV